MTCKNPPKPAIRAGCGRAGRLTWGQDEAGGVDVPAQVQDRAGTDPGSEILATCSAIGSVDSGCISAE